MATNPTAQAAANPPTNQPVVNPQPQTTTFALTPSKAIPGVIDYSTKFGAAIWNNNTKPLTEKYNLDPKTLSGFLSLVKERVEVAGWDMTIDVNGTKIDVLTHYGTVTPEQVKQTGLLVTAGQDRAAQNSYQLAHFLRESLTEHAKMKLAVKETDYTTNGVTHGLSLLKAVIGAASIDTRYTIVHIKKQISSLFQEMLANDNNIVNFNAKANMLEQELLARGGTISDEDLMLHLFEGYTSCSDAEFVRYIEKNIWQRYLDNDLLDLDSKTFMTRAADKYKQRLEAGVWLQPTPEQKQIVALSAELDKMKKKRNDKQRGSKTKEDESGANEGKKRNSKNPKTYKKGYPEWKLQPPDPGNPQKKTVKDKVFHWCPHHQLWTKHEPKDCKKGNDSKTENGSLKPTGFTALVHTEWSDDE